MKNLILLLLVAATIFTSCQPRRNGSEAVRVREAIDTKYEALREKVIHNQSIKFDAKIKQLKALSKRKELELIAFSNSIRNNEPFVIAN